MNESMVEKKNLLETLEETLDSTPKRILVWKQQIPPRREIWSKSPGSHPEGNLGWENRIEKKSEVDLDQKKLTLTKKKLTVAFKDMTPK